MIQLEQRFITSNNKGGTNNPKYIVIHDTGNTSTTATAENHYKWLQNNNDLNRSAHIFVDSEKAIQVIDFNIQAYHTGMIYSDKIPFPICKNNNSIGIEFCINSDGDLEKTLKNTAEVTFQVMNKFGISFENIITHKMSSGKKCPSTFEKSPYLWDDFKQSIKSLMQCNQNQLILLNFFKERKMINTIEYWQKQFSVSHYLETLLTNIKTYIESLEK